VLEVFSQITAPKQIYLGRQGHPPEGHSFEGEELYIATQVLRWFDYHLRGFGPADNLKVTSAPAPFSVLPFTAAQFPSDEIGTMSLFLKAGGALSRKKKGPVQQETAGGIFRPERIRGSRLGTDIPSRSDMFSGRVEPLAAVPPRLEYTAEPFETNTEMIGSSEFTLRVSSATSSELSLVVRTFDVAADGTETEVTVGVMRVSGLRPGEIRPVTFSDYGDDWVFRAGHALRIKVSNIDFPDFRPPGVNDNLASELTIHTGTGFKSRMIVPMRLRFP
jgi:predicted acyl esterase